MSITLKEAVDFLLSNGYVFRYGAKLKFHQKLYNELNVTGVAKAVIKTMTMQAIDWTKRYVQFISDARIPSRGEGSRGDLYDLNKYSEGGMKAFRKAIEIGVVYEDLVASTALYYRSSVHLKVKIGRYMEEGLWRTDYENYMASKQAGDLSTHEKTQTSDGTASSYTVG